MNISTSPIDDEENQYRLSPYKDLSPYRELGVHTSPIKDIEKQFQVPIVKPKARRPKTKKKKVNIEELYNRYQSFYIDDKPTELLFPRKKSKTTRVFKPIKKVGSKSNLPTFGIETHRPSSPSSWSEYQKGHMSPIDSHSDEWKPDDEWFKKSDEEYFPGGSKRKKKRNTKRNKKSRKKRKKTIRKRKR